MSDEATVTEGDVSDLEERERRFRVTCRNHIYRDDVCIHCGTDVWAEMAFLREALEETRKESNNV